MVVAGWEVSSLRGWKKMKLISVEMHKSTEAKKGVPKQLVAKDE